MWIPKTIIYDIGVAATFVKRSLTDDVDKELAFRRSDEAGYRFFARSDIVSSCGAVRHEER